MDESQSRFYKKWQIPVPSQHPQDDLRSALKSGEKILHSISARAPIAETLNDICSALDCQLGNTVSLISMCGGHAAIAAEVMQTEALSGLHIFSSRKIVSDHGEELGSMETYCCVPRVPSAGEMRLLEEAQRLATLAIDREIKANDRSNSRASGNQPVPRRVLAWPDFMS
jgi:hypothetical protein